MEILERKPGETSRSYALRLLKYNIIQLELEPGCRISENELASQMGISRTPVREALMELAKVGIVEVYPQNGSVVSKIDIKMIAQSRFLRITLEKAVAEQVASEISQENLKKLTENIRLQEFYVDSGDDRMVIRLDDEFHRLLFEIADKKLIHDIINNMMIHEDRIRNMPKSEPRSRQILEDHKRILNAIAEKDPAKARDAMHRHLNAYGIDVFALAEKNPQYFINTELLDIYFKHSRKSN